MAERHRYFKGLALCLLAPLVLAAGCGSSTAVSDSPVSAPQGVTPAQWQSLREQLSTVLEQTGALKRPAAAPKDSGSQVQDLAIQSVPGGGTGGADAIKLSWSYRNSGDYDGNGQVLASDLSPIGIHFGAKDTDAAWPSARVADGNNDGRITAQDLTPIGQFYHDRVDGYVLQYAAAADAPDNAWTDVSAPGLPALLASGVPPVGGGFAVFTLTLDLPQPLGFYRLLPYDASGRGIASLPVQYASSQQTNQPPVAKLTATEIRDGVVGTKLVWDATASTDDGVGDGVGSEDGMGAAPGPPAIVKYEWDWDGDGVYDYVSRMPVPGGTPDPQSLPGYDATDNTIPSPTADFYYFESATPSTTVRLTDAGGLSSTASYQHFAGVTESWHTQVLPIEHDSQKGTIGIPLGEANGKPIILYKDLGENLFSSTSPDAQGSSWPQGYSFGWRVVGTTLITAAGNPASLMYQGNLPADLSFYRSSDQGGVVWPTPPVLIAGDAAFHPLELFVFDGNPVIYGYFDNSSNQFGFMFASNGEGLAWGTAEHMDFVPEPDHCITAVAGRLAVAQYKSSTGDLQYSRALDSSNLTWPVAPKLVDFEEVVGKSPVLFDLGGLPGIAYFDSTHEQLKFIRATDSEGYAWQDPVVLYHADGGGTSMKTMMLEGRPALSFVWGPAGSLYFVSANDGQGSSWGAPEPIDSSGLVLDDSGSFRTTNLISVAGMPTLTYLVRDPATGDGIGHPYRFSQFR